MVSAESVSLQGDKYIGTSYSKMDCQAFVERCLADSGLRKDLPGSNAWYREVRKNGWVGTPEECRKRFRLSINPESRLSGLMTRPKQVTPACSPCPRTSSSMTSGISI